MSDKSSLESLKEVSSLCREYASDAVKYWIDVLKDDSCRVSDRLTCSKLIIEYATLGADHKMSDLSLSNKMVIEILGRTVENKSPDES